MVKHTIRIECPEYFNLYMACHTHGWVNLSPFYWDESKESLYIALFANGQPVDIFIRQSMQYVIVSVISFNKLQKYILSLLKSLIKRSLSFDFNIDPLLRIAQDVGNDYADLIKKGAGRILKSPSLWEDAAKTLFTTNCSWSLTKKICNCLCSSNFSEKTPLGLYPFPNPNRFKNYDSIALKKVAPVGYRSPYLIKLSKYFSNNTQVINGFESRKSYSEIKKIIESFNGFGVYATNHLMVLIGFFNEVPIDTIVTKFLKNNYNVVATKEFIESHYGKWGEYKWWGFKLEKMILNQNWIGG